MSAHSDGPVLVLTALDLENLEVRRRVIGLRPHAHAEGTIFEVGQLPGGGEIVLALIGEGNLSAATLAERARETFQPRAMLMVGIAGALRDGIELGDIVVGQRIYSYHGAKEEAGEHLVRPRAWDADHALLQLAHHIYLTDSWSRYLTSVTSGILPKVHFRPVAAGEVLLNSRDTPLAQQLRRNFNDAVAIEMESAGVAQAGHLARSLPVLTIRGISDKADGRKYSADQAGYQQVAAAHAAVFSLAVAAELFAADPASPAVAASPPAPRGITQNVNAWGGGDAIAVANGAINNYGVAPDHARDDDER